MGSYDFNSKKETPMPADAAKAASAKKSGKDETVQKSLAEVLEEKRRERQEAATSQVMGSAQELQEGQVFKNAGVPGSAAGPDYGYDRIRLHKKDEVSVYAQERDARFAMDHRTAKCILLCLVFVLVFFACILLPNNIFYTDVYTHDLAWFSKILNQNISNFVQFVTSGNAPDSYSIVVFTIMVIALSGAGLGAVGACYQGALKNAMASPSTLGVTSGGTVGAVIYVLLNYSTDSGTNGSGAVSSVGDNAVAISQLDLLSYVQLMYGKALFSLLGCLIVVGIVVLVAVIAGRGKVSNVALVIAGQVIAAIASAVVQMVRYYLTLMAPDSAALAAVENLQNGTVGTTDTLMGVIIVAIPILLGLAVLFFMRHRLNILAFNDVEARSMGISTVATRNLLVGTCTFITAVIVSFCGMMGFIGFLVPLIIRRIVGSDFRYVVPASALGGAIMLVVTYYLTTLGIAGVVGGQGLGMFTSIIGCAVFIVVVIRQRGRRNIDWV